jgi:hypothetical protein
MTGVRGGRVRIGLIIAATSVGFATVGLPNVVYGAGRPAHVRPAGWCGGQGHAHLYSACAAFTRLPRAAERAGREL